MKKLLYLTLFSVSAFLLFMAPTTVDAFEVNATTDNIKLSDNITPAPITIIDTPSQPPEAGIVEDTFGVAYSSPGTTYIGTFTVTGTDDDTLRAPMVIISGGKLQNYSWNNTTKQATIAWIGDQFTIPGETTPINESAFVFIRPALTNPTRDNPQVAGPPASMAGGYISTNIKNWQMNPPSGPKDFGFGLSLNDLPGKKGYFTIHMPSTMIDLMSTMSDKTVTAKDMAIFIDGHQASIKKTITADGGVIFNINLTFSSGNTKTSSFLGKTSTATITKTAMAQKKKNLSASFTKAIVKKEKIAKLYGWLSVRKKKNGKKIRILRKKKGQKKYKKVATVKVKKKSGRYIHKFIPEKKGTYFYKAKHKKKKSAKVRLKVRK